MSKNRLHDFSEKTRKNIIKKSGGRCSIKGCYEYVDNGYVSHIYPSSENGPQRSFDGLLKSLNSNDYKSPSNGIYTCRNCAEIIDNKSYITDYPASDLILFKAFSEYTTKILNKYSDIKQYELNFGYKSLIEKIWEAIRPRIYSFDFGFEVDKSNDEYIKKIISKEHLFLHREFDIENRIIKLRSYRKSIESWSNFAIKNFQLKDTVEYILMNGTWSIETDAEFPIGLYKICGSTNQLIFKLSDKFALENNDQKLLIKCKILDTHIYNFNFEFSAFDDGSHSTKFVFFSINHVKVATYNLEDLCKIKNQLKYIQSLSDKKKHYINISDLTCYYGEKNDGTLPIEFNPSISEKTKDAYVKISNLFEKILPLKEIQNIDFVIDFEIYLNRINESQMFNALHQLESGLRPENILINKDSSFNYFLSRNKNFYIYKIKIIRH